MITSKYSLSFKSPHGYAWVNYLEFLIMCFHTHLKVLTVMMYGTHVCKKKT